MPLHQKKRVLVTVKAYPNPSGKYGETVCVAGIDIDTDKWIRLYPVTYRDMDEDLQFKKYNLIEIEAIKSSSDHRPESYKIKSGCIQVIGQLGTESGYWQKRKEIVLPTESRSFCKILAEQIEARKSLGMFKPSEIEFSIEERNCSGEQEKIDKCSAQLTLYNKTKDDLEPIPFYFRYSFKCANEISCPGHTLPIIDWEMGQAYRSWRHRYPSKEILFQKIKETWLDGMCSPNKDTYFFVGNMHRFPHQFLILGVFYPKRRT